VTGCGTENAFELGLEGTFVEEEENPLPIGVERTGLL
jgi:hypothetical protein